MHLQYCSKTRIGEKIGRWLVRRTAECLRDGIDNRFVSFSNTEPAPKHPTISCIFVLLSLGSAAFTHAQAPTLKKPITHESLWMMKRVGAVGESQR
jgi:hypothetical protein